MSDWITAASTLATAVMAWLVYRHLVNQERPVVVSDFAWKTDPVLGRHVEIKLEIFNRLDEPLMITSAEVNEPRLASISEPDRSGVGAQPYSGTLRPGPPSKRPIVLDWRLAAKGSVGTWADRAGRADRTVQTLYVFPPPSWDGGNLQITLVASRSSSAARDRRITITPSTPMQKSSVTLENASNTG
jgi:hypothetical protein